MVSGPGMDLPRPSTNQAALVLLPPSSSSSELKSLLIKDIKRLSVTPKHSEETPRLGELW